MPPNRRFGAESLRNQPSPTQTPNPTDPISLPEGPTTTPVPEIGGAGETRLSSNFRRTVRFSKIAAAPIEGVERMNASWQAAIRELSDIGVPNEAIKRLEDLGPEKILRSPDRLPKSVTAVLNKENMKPVKDIFRLAKVASEGLDPKATKQIFEEALSALSDEPFMKTPDGKRILSELRKLGAKGAANISIGEAVSVLEERGDDPMITRVYNKILRKSPSAKVPEELLSSIKEASGGASPQATSRVQKAVRGAGVAGAGPGRSAVRSAVGALSGRGFGGGLLAAAGAGLQLSRAIDPLKRESRAKELALMGYGPSGAGDSVDILRNRVMMQEAAGRRRTVLQQSHPELFQEVVRVLASQNVGSGGLTSTERRIGSGSRGGVQSSMRRPEDVEFLLNQLFAEMG